MKKTVIFGCVTDQNQKFLDQALRLVASLRWFGGSLANAPFHVCAVEGMPDTYKQRLERLGASIHPVARFDARHGPSNKLRFLEMEDLQEYDIVALLDCDTLIVQDPAPYLPHTGFSAKPADLATVTSAQFDRIYAKHNFAPPVKNCVSDITGEQMYPYFNSGVCLFTRSILASLREAWIRWDRKMIDEATLLGFPPFYADQASLALALLETGIEVTQLPPEMNFPAHFEVQRYPSKLRQIDPVIIHYHHLAYLGAGIAPLAMPRVWERAQGFNERMKQIGLLKAAA